MQLINLVSNILQLPFAHFLQKLQQQQQLGSGVAALQAGRVKETVARWRGTEACA